jgi:hypothetical protein
MTAMQKTELFRAESCPMQLCKSAGLLRYAAGSRAAGQGLPGSASADAIAGGADALPLPMALAAAVGHLPLRVIHGPVLNAYQRPHSAHDHTSLIVINPSHVFNWQMTVPVLDAWLQKCESMQQSARR